MAKNLKIAVGVVAVVAVVVAMGLDTRIVHHGDDDDANSGQFSAKAYGQKELPKARRKITERAESADKLASALEEDKDQAVEDHGVANDMGPIMSVKFKGKVGEGRSGTFDVKVDGVPDDLQIRLITGPQINGTVLRDGAGDVDYEDFENQIQYQNAGAGLNDALKKAVLSDLDRDDLEGKTVKVVGVFQLITPNNWQVLPVSLEVQ